MQRRSQGWIKDCFVTSFVSQSLKLNSCPFNGAASKFFLWKVRGLISLRKVGRLN